MDHGLDGRIPADPRSPPGSDPMAGRLPGDLCGARRAPGAERRGPAPVQHVLAAGREPKGAGGEPVRAGQRRGDIAAAGRIPTTSGGPESSSRNCAWSTADRHARSDAVSRCSPGPKWWRSIGSEAPETALSHGPCVRHRVVQKGSILLAGGHHIFDRSRPGEFHEFQDGANPIAIPDRSRAAPGPCLPSRTSRHPNDPTFPLRSSTASLRTGVRPLPLAHPDLWSLAVQRTRDVS